MLSGRESVMRQTTQERRLMRRFDMHLPAAIKLAGIAEEPIATETKRQRPRNIFLPGPFLDPRDADRSHHDVSAAYHPDRPGSRALPRADHPGGGTASGLTSRNCRSD